jgi:hypothetical protein
MEKQRELFVRADLDWRTRALNCGRGEHRWKDHGRDSETLSRAQALEPGAYEKLDNSMA